MPDLCADRVDYGLRDFTAKFGFSEKISNYISHLIVQNNEIIFDDKDAAEGFARDYLLVDETLWAYPREVAFFQVAADAITMAMEKGILSEEDLFKDDNFVWEKLKNSGNKEIMEKLRIINPKMSFKDDPDDYDFHSCGKLRYVDPQFVEEGEIKRVTAVSQDFAKKLEERRKLIERGNYIKIVSW